MSDKERYLASAAECERLARRSVSKEDQATLLHMAKLWRELAETAAAVDWRDDVRRRLDGTDEVD